MTKHAGGRKTSCSIKTGCSVLKNSGVSFF